VIRHCPGFDDNHDPLCPLTIVWDTEGGSSKNVACLFGHVLEFLRRVVTPPLDDELLAATGDVQLAPLHKPEISCVKPTLPKHLGSLCLISKIALHQGGTPQT